MPFGGNCRKSEGLKEIGMIIKMGKMRYQKTRRQKAKKAKSRIFVSLNSIFVYTLPVILSTSMTLKRAPRNKTVKASKTRESAAANPQLFR